jgi:hypothetical protein
MTPLASGSVRAAVFAVMLWLIAQAGHTMWLCAAHNAWVRVHADPSTVVLAQGVSIARPGDAIFVCETPHRSGPITWHLDLDCYCAPEASSADQVGQTLGGTCTVDKLHPTSADDAGACRYGRCSKHLDVLTAGR